MESADYSGFQNCSGDNLQIGCNISRFRKIFIFYCHALNRGSSWDEQVTGTCECSNEPSSSIKCRRFLDKLGTIYLLKDSAQWSKKDLFFLVMLEDIMMGNCMLILQSCTNSPKYLAG